MTRRGAQWAVFVALAISTSTLPPDARASAHEVELTLDGDWRIKAVVPGVNGDKIVATIEVPPPKWITVTAEPHASLPVFNPKAGGWAKGARLQAVVAQECTTPFLIDPASLVLRPSPAVDAVPLTGKVGAHGPVMARSIGVQTGFPKVVPPG
jgi:hypothetical protein